MEEVVIAGMSGKLPESENLQEFWDNLMGGVDMVTDDDRRWKAGEWPRPLCCGRWRIQAGFGIGMGDRTGTGGRLLARASSL